MVMSLVSDRPLKGHEEHLLRVMERLDSLESEVDSLALVAIMKDGTAAVTYYKMEVTDLMRAASELQLEAIDTSIINNIDRYADAIADYELQEEELENGEEPSETGEEPEDG